MKPKEFDELVRQKFEQNDFEYDPRNWDRLAEQMDGRAKKRSIIMWWLMPLAGVAASVALAVGVSPVMRQVAPAGINAGVAQTRTIHSHAAQNMTAATASSADINMQLSPAAKSSNTPHASTQAVARETEDGEDVRINLLNAVPNTTKKPKTTINLLNAEGIAANKKENKKEQAEVVATFKPEAEQKTAKTSLILNGGYNTGSVSSGYAAGATIRHMVSDRVYIESDVDFLSSSNIQTNGHVNSTVINVYGNSAARTSGAGNTGARTTGGSAGAGTGTTTGSTSTTDASKTTDNDAQTVTKEVVTGPLQNMNLSYEMNYAQISPSIGYKVTRKFSIGAGPDIQQALSDKRPATDNTDPNVQLQAPLFDLGLMGKTEYALTKKVRAGLYYRKGINNLLTPDKYTERDYMQFQLKYTLFNK